MFDANFDQDLRPCPRPREKDIVADEVTELQGRPRSMGEYKRMNLIGPAGV